ncbi:MAG: hypothetical protein KC457_35705, partial [Myxococcales bacterium]|nr:hypothetical protein [Myxococcales bacterium]
DDLAALVADVLDDGPESLALAQLLFRRTRGTPLYVAQLLMAFYAEGIIDIDRSRGQWRVDLARAHRRESSGDVVDFLIEQFAALPDHVRRLLGIAACIGASFDLETLAVAADRPVSEVGVLVWEAVGAGYLRPASTDQGIGLGGGATVSTHGPASEYGFVHDRLRQVALESSDQDQPKLYLTLASRLVDGDRLAAVRSGAGFQTLAGYIGRALALVEGVETRRRFAVV